MKLHRLHASWARTTPVKVAANADWYGMASAEENTHVQIPQLLLRLDALPPWGDDTSAIAVDVMGSIEDLWARLAARGAIRVLSNDKDRVKVSIKWPENCHVELHDTRELMNAATLRRPIAGMRLGVRVL